ncbi:MAG: LytTR family DNA-binding domain-containing protein [Bacteroidota bacterium]
MIRVAIVDDELNSRELLRNMLTEYCEEVEVVGEAEDVESGIELLKKQTVDLALLDIEMPGGDGFEILNAFPYKHFKVIFITGYDQYAIRAIKYAALDYLLKPLDLSELKQAIRKAQRLNNDQSERLQVLEQQYHQEEQQLQQIVLPDRGQYNLIHLKEVLYISAQGSYVLFYLEDGSSKITSNSLSYYEELLPNDRFFRIHKSHIVNVAKVKSYETGRAGNALLTNGMSIPVAARRKSTFVHLWNQINRPKTK